MPEWKNTVNLPRTDFPMKANLQTAEPEAIARWEAMDLYGQIRALRRGAPKFVFHDGPPYANARIHLGHALNKTLKDFVIKSRSMEGFDAAYLPHFGSKVGVEGGLKASGVEWTILRPNNFYQNDVWFKDAILQYGVYPQPLGDKGCSRVDVRDIAEAAAIALTDGGHAGETYNLVGPEALTGKRTAEIWASVLDRPIAYAGNDLDAWEKQFLQYMPAWMVFDYKQMYAFFQDKGFGGTPEDVARQTKLIGHPPRRFEDYARETAASWKASP